MAHALPQPTLSLASDALQRRCGKLGLTGTAAWCALHSSTALARPIMSHPKLTGELVQYLEIAGILTSCTLPDPRAHRAIYEPVSWHYRDLDLPSESIQAGLEAALQLRIDEADEPDRHSLWRLLAHTESEAYLRHLLQRHHLDGGNITALLSTLRPEWEAYSLGRRRYLAWFSVHRAAAALVEEGFDETAAYSVLETQVRRRGRWIAAEEAKGRIKKDDYCFIPDENWRRSIFLDIFLSRILPVGRGFWTSAPPERT